MGSNKPLIKTLIIDPDGQDALRSGQTLAEAGYAPDWLGAASSGQLDEALDQGPWDLVLGEAGLPGLPAVRMLEKLEKRGCQAPFVLVTGRADQKDTLGLMAAGVEDIVFKDRLWLLGPVAGRLLGRARPAARPLDILESLEEGYYEVDRAGRFTYVNQAFCDIYGRGRDELLRMNYRQVLPKPEASRVFAEFNRLYQGGQPLGSIAMEIQTGDGEVKKVEGSAVLIGGNGSSPTGFRGIVRDLTESIKAAQEREALEAQLVQAQKMEAIGAMAGGLAHDFNNILAGVQGNISLARLSAQKGAEADLYLRAVERLVEKGAGLARQLLDFSRGGLTNRAPLDLNQVVAECSNMFERIRKEVRLHRDLAPGLKPVEANRGQIEQVLLNLFVNAAQAITGAGNIHLKTANLLVREPGVPAPELTPGPWVALEVRDDGHGMEEKVASRIFEAFFTTKERGIGTGLGLSSAYGIIKRHGGHIAVDSQPGRGSTFTVYLPASNKEPLAEQVRAEEPLTGEGSVLFIDDERFILDVAGELLETLGYTAYLAQTAPEALRLLERHAQEIEVAILDLVMPGMSAAELFGELKKIKPGLKVILSSGYNIEEKAGEPLASGVDGQMQKPFSIFNLSTQLKKVHKKSSSR